MILLLLGCSGEWGLDLAQPELVVQTDDGCTATFERAQLSLGGVGTPEQPLSEVSGQWDLAEGAPGPVLAAGADRGRYESITLSLMRQGLPGEGDAPELAELGASVLVAGTLDCDQQVSFELDFYPDTRADCALDAQLEVGADPVWVPVEAHLSRLFSSSLLPDEGELLGQPWVDSDSDDDGALSLEELESQDLAPLGYTVGSYEGSLDLLSHIGRASGQILSVPQASCTHRCLVDDAC